MSRNAENLSMEEAVALITQHFQECDGIIAQVERGEKIDGSQVRMIEEALRCLQLAWKGKELVPKHAVRLFWNVIPRLEKCILLYPHRTDEVSKLMSDLIGWFDGVFSSSLMSEEDAIVLVTQHMIGLPPLSIELRFGNIREDSVEELLMALNVLADTWKTREDISKLAAHAMVSTQAVFMAVSDLFSGTEKQRLNAIEQQLNERITECLS